MIYPFTILKTKHDNSIITRLAEKALKIVIERSYGEVNVPFVKSEIDRAHRIGKSYTNIASGEIYHH